jgi:hypothetical protein
MMMPVEVVRYLWKCNDELAYPHESSALSHLLFRSKCHQLQPFPCQNESPVEEHQQEPHEYDASPLRQEDRRFAMSEAVTGKQHAGADYRECFSVLVSWPKQYD